MTAQDAIIQFLSDHEPQMFALLEQMVCIQSGSRNKPGVDATARFIASSFKGCRVSCRIVEQKDFGNHLIVRSVCKQTTIPQILLVGHMDTVFPEDTDFNTYREDAGHAYGPGVIDMKGGLVVGIFAVKALDAAGLLPGIPLTFIFNSDEEIGSRTSRDLIRQEARKSACAFVLECGGPNGEIVTGRKGNLSVNIRIKGKAGHAAFAGRDKASAIVAMANKIISIEALNCPEKGMTANVGKVWGGIGPNTVAEHCEALADFRFERPEDYSGLLSRIDEIISASEISGTAAQLETISRRPPMPAVDANRRLFRQVQQTARKLGMTVAEEFRQGVSDANIIAEEGVPVVDGMGPMGGRDHSTDEYMIKSSLLKRARLLACALADLSYGRELTENSFR